MAMLALAAMSVLPAGGQTWDGGDTSAYWTNALNWVGDALPDQNSAILFDSASAPNLNNTLGQSFGVKSLTFGPTQTTPVTINLTDATNETLTFNPGTAVTVSAGDHRIVGPALGAGTFGGIVFYNETLPTLNVAQVGNVLTMSWAAASANYRLQAQTNGLASGGWFDYPGGGSSPVNAMIDPAGPAVFYRLASSGIFYTFDVATGASLEIAGRMRQLGSAGTRNYYKTGGGTLWLSADNGGNSGWVGPGDIFTVNQGTLNMGNKARGNSGMKFVVNNGGTLRVSGDEATPSGTCTLAGHGVSGNGALEFAPTAAAAPTGLKLDTSRLILSADASIGVEAGTNGTINKCGLMGAFTMTKVGQGMLELGSIITNTTWAAMIVSNGTLKISGAITNPATTATVVTGGTFRVDGTFSRYDGPITVQSGGKLEGSGTINGPVTVDGELAPGVGSTTQPP